MKLALIQMAPELADVDKTIAALERHFDAASGVDIVVLTELCNSGYNFRSVEQARQSSEPVGNGPFSEFLLQQSKKLNCHIVSGINERDGDTLYNSAVLVRPDGVAGKFRKMHLYLNEPDFFAPGNAGLPVFEVGDANVGILVCFDWAFPEVWRAMALNGADVVCHPSNIMNPRRALRALPGHALCNRMFIATCNRVGSEHDLTFGGMSTVIAPTGEIVAQASERGEEVLIVEIDPHEARDKQLTPRNHILEDRRPEEYRRLVDES